jgi:hypothetical protein
MHGTVMACPRRYNTTIVFAGEIAAGGIGMSAGTPPEASDSNTNQLTGCSSQGRRLRLS